MPTPEIVQLLKVEQWDPALTALQAVPESAESLYHRGICHEGLGERDAALQAFEGALQHEPGHQHILLALAQWHLTGEVYGVAADYLQRAWPQRLRSPVALRVAAGLERALGTLPEALQALRDQALEAYREAAEGAEKDAAQPWLDYAAAAKTLREYETAVGIYEHLIRLEPRNATYLNDLAVLLRDRGAYVVALQHFHKAIALDPRNAWLHQNAGEALLVLGSKEAAAAALETALAFQPDLNAAKVNLATILSGENEHVRALSLLEEVVADDPKSWQAINLQANIYNLMGRGRDSAEAYERALAINPDSALVFSNWLLALNYRSDLSCASVYRAHRRYAERFDKAFEGAHANAPDPGRKLRIGFVSSDFRFHSVAYFIEPVLTFRDRASWECFAYANVQTTDDMTTLLQRRADHWRDVRGQSDRQIAERIREDQIDVLVDLTGHTGRNLLTVFTHHPAPVQVSWLGYPNTTGLDAISYRLSDAVTEPLGEADAFSSETIVRLPEGFHAFRNLEGTPPASELPAARSGTITFGSFNNSAKITREVIRIWSRLIRAVPGSRLVLKNSGYAHPDARQATLDAFAEEGIEAARITVLPRNRELQDHLKSYALMDIALDCFPYNGTTTTLQALYMGVPVLTLMGDRHASRVSASLLHQMDMDDWVAADEQDFVRRGVQHARDLSRLAELRRGLRGRYDASPLADFAGFCQKLDIAFRDMWIDWCARQPGADPAALEDARAQQARSRLKRDARIALRAARRCEAKGAFATAEEHFLAALACDPDNPTVCAHAASCLHDRGAREAALQLYNRAEASGALNAVGLANAASCHLESGDAERACMLFRQALDADSARPGIWLNYAAACQRARRWVDAEAAARQALEQQPAFPEAHNTLGSILKDQGRFDEAVACFCTALDQRPDFACAHSNLLFCLQYVPELSLGELQEHHTGWALRHRLPEVEDTAQLYARDTAPGQRLTLAYCSPDLHSHPVATFLEPLLRHHDRSRFRTILLHDSAFVDATTARLRSLVDHYEATHTLDADALQQRLRTLGVDILVDLAGHTHGARLPLFTRRQAPLQLSYLGYPHPLSDLIVDAWIADPVLAAGLGEHSADAHILALAGGSHCYQPPVDAPAVATHLASERNGYLTFGYLGNATKLNLPLLRQWAQLLAGHADARLLLQAPQWADSGLVTLWQQRFTDAGLDPARIDCIAPDGDHAEHLRRYHAVDIALDPAPYSGTTGTCEALWMGVPVVTLPWARPFSRTTASLLHQIGRDDWVAADAAGWLACIHALALDADARKAWLHQAREHCRASTLLDGARFTTAFEAGLQDLWLDTQARSHQPPAAAALPA